MENPQGGRVGRANYGPIQNMCRFCTFGLRHSVCKDCFDGLETDLTNLKEDHNNQETITKSGLETVQNLEEEIKFLTKWNFTPAQASETGDVTLVCTLDGSFVQAHSFILCNKSNVFLILLKNVKEKNKQLQIDVAGGDSVKTFVNFLYTAYVSDEDMYAHSKELGKLAHFYQVEALLERLDNFISSSNYNRDDFFVEAVKMAYSYDLKNTKNWVYHYIVNTDSNNDLFDMAFKELQAEKPGMAHQYSKDVISRLQSRQIGRGFSSRKE